MKIRDLPGFTFIELLIVFSLFFIITGAGMVKFSQFTTSQILNSSVGDITGFLNSTRTSAVSQTMLGTCTQTLQSYRVRISPPSTYQMWAYCNATNFPLNKPQNLPSGVTFDTGTSPEITFTVQTGYSSGGTIKLKGSVSAKTIKIDTTGNITVQ